jgi:AcrR family transcriptional regulator
VIETDLIGKNLSGKNPRGNDLGRGDWLRAARLALLKGGVEAVRVERLSRDLHVTKGSFYWHFKDREELLELLLREWEQELLDDIIPRLKGRRGEEALPLLMRLMIRRVPLGEQGRLPSDAAVFTWAAVAPEVARRVNRAEKKRIEALTHVLGFDRAELLYLVWLGFVSRGQRIPSSRRQFPQIARMVVELFPSRRKKRKVPEGRGRERR